MAAVIKSKNMHYAFNREYLDLAVRGVDDKNVQNFNELLLGVVNKDTCAQIEAFGRQQCEKLQVYGAKNFCVKVLYPGLLIGTGYPHETGKTKGEIQVGALFDYATGAPYYPGSSVKGVLRDVFKRANESGAEADEYRNYLLSFFPEKFDRNRLGEFEEETFDGIDPNSLQPKRIGERDIFFDAYIIGTVKAGVKILKMDNLAPHNNQPLNDPIPINMLRIAPGACLQFNMKLTNSSLGVTAEQKLEMFKNILLDLGFGAKRNVGYGAAEEISREVVKFIEVPKAVKPTAPVSEMKRAATVEERGKNTGEVIGTCPKCGNAIMLKGLTAFCSGNCGINLNRYQHTRLYPSQIKDLCSGKTISYLSKKKLKLTAEGYKEV